VLQDTNRDTAEGRSFALVHDDTFSIMPAPGFGEKILPIVRSRRYTAAEGRRS
jgi:hypothetical protein